MCIEDIRLGRQTKSVQTNQTIDTLSTPFIQQDPLRVTLTFWPPPSGTLTLSIRSPVVANEGIVLPAASPPITLDIRTHGDLCTKQWFGIHSLLATLCTAHEGRLEAT